MNRDNLKTFLYDSCYNDLSLSESKWAENFGENAKIMAEFMSEYGRSGRPGNVWYNIVSDILTVPGDWNLSDADADALIEKAKEFQTLRRSLKAKEANKK